jgi:hypothetical protein
MKRIYIDFIAALIGAIMITTSAQAAQVWVEPAYLKTSTGENFTVNIMVDPEGAEVFGAQYYLYFNNTLLNAANQMQGTFLGGITIVNDINNIPGRIMYGEFRTGSAGVTTPGVLASISFEVIGERGVCELVLKDVILSDPDAQEIANVTISNGSIRIGEIPPYIVDYTISNRTITPPQTTEIDVEFSEYTKAWISIEDSSRKLVKELYYSAKVKNPAPKIWNGTYADGTRVPDGNYYVNITGTNTTTGLNVINNTEIIKVTGAKPEVIPGVKIQVIGIPVTGINTSDILKVEYTNFISGDAYNVSITFNGTQVYYDSGNLTGTSPEIIPINWTASSTGNHTILAWGSGMVDSTPVHICDSTVIAPIPELATIILAGAGMIGLIGIRRWYGK